MAKPKEIKVVLNPNQCFGYTGDIMEMDYKKFHDWASGELVLAIGKGDFRSQLFQVLNVAQCRGQKFYHDRLIKEAKESK